jgi:hypothetical protein
MKFLPQLRLPSYTCGSAGQSCDWKEFVGSGAGEACCFTCTDLERISKAWVIDLRVLDIFSCLSKSLTSRSANRCLIDQSVAEAGSWKLLEDESGEGTSVREAKISLRRAG